MSLHHYCQPADGVLNPKTAYNMDQQHVRPRVTQQLITDTSLPYIIVDMIASHTRVNRKPLHICSSCNSSANGVWTGASSIDRQKHAHGRGDVHSIRVPLQRTQYCVCACAQRHWASIQSRKLKPWKLILTATYFQLFTKIGTSKNYPPYGMYMYRSLHHHTDSLLMKTTLSKWFRSTQTQYVLV